MEKPKDYYVILGVARNASTAAIKRAFRRLAKKYHPDLSAKATTQDFQDLQAAYETLADAERRRRYDESLARRPLQAALLVLRAQPRRGRPAAPGAARVAERRDPAHPDGSGSGRGAAAGRPHLHELPVLRRHGRVRVRLRPLRRRGQGREALPGARCASRKGARDGTVFQVSVDEPGVLSILLTIHIRPL